MRNIFRGLTVMGIIAMAAAIVLSSPLAFAEKGVSDTDMSIRKKSVFDEKGVTPDEGKYTDKAPGDSKKIKRAFENSPPLIPHDITGMLPIAVTNNMCMGCHMPKEAKASGAVAIPKSHLMDLATGKDLKGKLHGERYNCMQCHVQQVELPATVENLFKEDFRDERSRYNSNLADTLNEGVK